MNINNNLMTELEKKLYLSYLISEENKVLEQNNMRSSLERHIYIAHLFNLREQLLKTNEQEQQKNPQR